jgi:hypothetical protein
MKIDIYPKFGAPSMGNLEAMKYLGFSLKENNYSTKDWQWIYANVEK